MKRATVLFLRSRLQYGTHTPSAINIVGTTCVRLPVFSKTHAMQCIAASCPLLVDRIVQRFPLLLDVYYMLVHRACADQLQNDPMQSRFMQVFVGLNASCLEGRAGWADAVHADGILCFSVALHVYTSLLCH